MKPVDRLARNLHVKSHLEGGLAASLGVSSLD